MCVRDVPSGKQEGDPPHPVDLLQPDRQPLAEMRDARSERRRKIVEIRIVVAGNDLHMPRTDGMNVEERADIGVGVNGMRMHLARGDAAEQAFGVIVHGWRLP